MAKVANITSSNKVSLVSNGCGRPGRTCVGGVNNSACDDFLIIYVDGDAARLRMRSTVLPGAIACCLGSLPWLRLPESTLIELQVVSEGLDAADDWIVDHIAPGDIAVTADIPLAARCLEKGAVVLGPSGKPFNADNIGGALATRDLMADLRDRGAIRGNNPSFTKQDRIRFLNALDNSIQAARRAAG